MRKLKHSEVKLRGPSISTWQSQDPNPGSLVSKACALNQSLRILLLYILFVTKTTKTPTKKLTLTQIDRIAATAISNFLMERTELRAKKK